MISSISKFTRLSSILYGNGCISIWRNSNRQIQAIPSGMNFTFQFPSHFFSTTSSNGKEGDIAYRQGYYELFNRSKPNSNQSVVINEDFLKNTKATSLLSTLEKQGDFLSSTDIHSIIEALNQKSSKSFIRDMEKLTMNLSKKRKYDSLKMVYQQMILVNPQITSNYRITDAIARACMNQQDEELFTQILPFVEKNKKISPFSHGLYIRFLCTLHHLDEGLDDYAELTPDYLHKNPSITSDLVTGMYNGGYYQEVIHMKEYLASTSFIQTIDSVNYARLMTETIKAEAKIGQLETVLNDLEDCFSKHTLFLPLSYVDILTNMITCEEWKKKHSLIECYNYAVLALRKYQSHTMTESSLLTASHQWNDDHSCYLIQCGSLSLPIFEVNIIALIGELEKNEIEGKMIKIQSNDYQNEIHELIEKLFPSCNYQNENNDTICLNASTIYNYYKDGLLK